MALLEKRRFLYNHSGDFPQVILIVPSHVPNRFFLYYLYYLPEELVLCCDLAAALLGLGVLLPHVVIVDLRAHTQVRLHTNIVSISCL